MQWISKCVMDHKNVPSSACLQTQMECSSHLSNAKEKVEAKKV